MIRVAKKVNPQKYGRLLSKTLPTIIKTEAENDRAILIVEELLAKAINYLLKKTLCLNFWKS